MDDYRELAGELRKDRDNLRQWLEYIASIEGSPLWYDDRDDCADTMIRAADEALNGTDFNEWKKNID